GTSCRSIGIYIIQHMTNRIRIRLLLSAIPIFLVTGMLHAQDETWFTDITKETNLEGVKGGQVSALDINNDGWPDLLLQNLSYDRSMKTRIYMNQQGPASSDPRDRIFVDVTDSAGVYANPDPNVTGRIADVWGMADVNN